MALTSATCTQREHRERHDKVPEVDLTSPPVGCSGFGWRPQRQLPYRSKSSLQVCTSECMDPQSMPEWPVTAAATIFAVATTTLPASAIDSARVDRRGERRITAALPWR